MGRVALFCVVLFYFLIPCSPPQGNKAQTPSQDADYISALKLIAATPPPPPNEPPLRVGNIHQVDFRNFVYPLTVEYARAFGAPTARVVNGEAHSITYRLWVQKVMYSHFTGSGEDALVQLCTEPSVPATGHAYTCNTVWLYTTRSNRLELVSTTQIPQYDHEDGLLYNVDLNTTLNDLYVDHMGPPPLCCPKYLTRRAYRWNGFTFVETRSVRLGRSYTLTVSTVDAHNIDFMVASDVSTFHVTDFDTILLFGIWTFNRPHDILWLGCGYGYHLENPTGTRLTSNPPVAELTFIEVKKGQQNRLSIRCSATW